MPLSVMPTPTYDDFESLTIVAKSGTTVVNGFHFSYEEQMKPDRARAFIASLVDALNIVEGAELSGVLSHDAPKHGELVGDWVIRQCKRFGLPDKGSPNQLFPILLRHVQNNSAAIYGANQMSIRALEEKLDAKRELADEIERVIGNELPASIWEDLDHSLTRLRS